MIKTELRIIELKEIEVLNTKFTKNTSYWNNTGTTQWSMSEWENAVRSSTGDTSMLFQDLSGIETGKTYKVSYQVIRNSGETITPYFADTSGTTRSLSGKYTDYFTLATGITITDNLLGFIPSSDFDGGVTDMQVSYYDYDEYGIQLYDDLSYNLTFQVFDIDNLEQRASSFSKTIKIPGTSRNNEIFNHLYDIDIEETETYIRGKTRNYFFNKKLDCELLYDSIPIKEGFFELQKSYYNESTRQIEYEGVFYSRTTNFSESVGDKLLVGNTEIGDDLDFTEYNHELNMDNFIASHSGTYYDNSVGYYYPIIDYANLDEYNFTDIESFRPSLYVKEIIDKIFEDVGYTYSSTFFDSAFFKSLIIPWVGDVKEDEDELDSRNLRVSMNDIDGTTDFTGNGPIIWGDISQYAYRDFYNDSPIFLKSSPSGPLPPTVRKIPLDKDSPLPYYNSAGNDFDTSNYYWEVPTKGKYRIEWSSGQNIYLIPLRYGEPYYNYFCYILGDGNIEVKLQLYKNEDGFTTLIKEQTSLVNVPYNTPEATIGGGDVWIPAWQDDIMWSGVLKKGAKVWAAVSLSNYNIWAYSNGQQGAHVRAWMDVMSSRGFGQNFKVTAENSYTLYEGEIVEMNKALPPETKQIDFFKNICNMFNLVVDEYPNTDKKLYIETRLDYYASGSTLDWTNKEDLSIPEEIERIPTLINKDFSIGYEEDNDDYNERYSEENRNLIYGNTTIKNPYLSNDKYKIEITSSPTPLSLLGYTNWAVSKIFKTDSNGNATESEFNNRILYRSNIAANGVNVQEGYLLPYYIVHSGTSSTSFGYSPYHNGTDYEYQPYAGHFNDPYTPTVDLNFGICNVYYYPILSNTVTNNNLYNLYWREYIDELMNLNSKRVTKYLKLGINDVYNFSFADKVWIDNVLYVVEKINEWNPGQVTKVELMKLDKFSFDTSTTADYEINVKYKKKSPTVRSNIINLQRPYSSYIRLYDTGTTTGYVSGGTSDFDFNNVSGTTNTTYVDRKNKIADGAYGIVIGDGNTINSGDVFIKGNNNTINTGSTDISIISSNNTIEEGASNIFITGRNNTVKSGATNVSILSNDITIEKDVSNVIVFFNDESGKTITTSNYIYIPSGYTIENYYNITETDDAIYSGITNSGVTKTYLESNYYNTGQTYTKTETDSTFRSTGDTVDWNDISDTPTGTTGYGITDVYTKTEADERYATQGGGFDYYNKSTQTYTSGDVFIIGDDYNGTGRTITLATAQVSAGKMYVIQDEVGNASSNNITIDTEGTETINGNANTSISTNFGKLFIYSDGTNWFS
jgi:hypothetical protein